MNEADSILFGHMLDAGKEAVSFTSKRTRQDFETDRQLILAVIKSIEIVGEAASRISKETRLGTTGVPWNQIIGMRNRLIHG